MKKSIKISAAVAGAGLILSGCATTINSSFDSFRAQSLDNRIKAGYLKQKTNNLLVIVDTSSSMAEAYDGQGFSGSEAAKFSVEKELLNRMNQTIPNIALKSGIRSFGSGSCSSWTSTNLNRDLSRHTKSSFASSLNTVNCTGGGSPMHAALEAASGDLASASGQTAVLILSDGYQMDRSPIMAAKALEAQYGNNLCIYGVWVGQQKEQSGRYLLQQLSDVSGCGFVTAAADIASPSGMANFVERVLMKPATPPVKRALDTDGDGVVDSRDKCPDTPRGAIVDHSGCWAFHGVFFDFNKATIKDRYSSMLKNVVKVMNLNPDLTIRVEGHTDNIGSAAYNQKLSERRAQAVKKRLVEMGIAPSRMTTKGFGFSEPVASNATEAGRAENRRVYFSRTDR